jgi:hypothetical protein
MIQYVFLHSILNLNIDINERRPPVPDMPSINFPVWFEIHKTDVNGYALHNFDIIFALQWLRINVFFYTYLIGFEAINFQKYTGMVSI